MTCDKCRNTGCDYHNSKTHKRMKNGCALFSGMSFLTCKRCY